MTKVQAQLADLLSGRYAIERELGRGGMATVFLAQDVRHRRPVAVKVLHPELAVSVGAERFLREIEIAAGLTHPHILPLHESGEAGGFLYYVMPFVDGESLRDRLDREGPQSLAAAMAVVRDVASALSYAHGRGLVHRDIKPENILLAEGGAVVADFGIAKAVGSVSGITHTGLAVGSPLYMSPEQAMGEKEIDGRSDLYSLGCVFYEMLIGEPPFTGEHVLGILARHTSDPMPAMRPRRPDLPDHIEAAVATLMAKAPADRFATGKELLDALDAEDGGLRLTAARHAAGPGSAPSRPSAAGQMGSLAVLPFRDRSAGGEQAHLCEGIAEDVLNALARARGIRVAARSSSFRFRDQDADVRAIGRELKVAAVLSGSVQRAGDRLRINVELSSTTDGFQMWAERYDREFTDVFAIQDEIATSIASALRVTLSGGTIEKVLVRRRTDNLAAYEQYLRGRHFWNKRHEVGFQQAIVCYQKALELDPLYALPYAGLADAFISMGAYGFLPPQEAWARVGATAGKALEIDADVPEALTSISCARGHFAGEWADAEAGFRRAMTLDPTYPTAPLWLSYLLSARGRHDEAIALSHRARDLEPSNPVLSALAAFNTYLARRYDQAIDEFRVALEVMPEQPIGHAFLGLTLLAQEQWEDAIAQLEFSRAFPTTPGYIGYAHARAGRTDAARRELRALEAAAARAYVPPLGRAMIHLGLGERQAALTLITACAEERTYLFTFAAVDPQLDALRGEPKFRAALERLGLGDVPSPL